ncbi:hypothetical protein CsatA_004099 [Cannabis sativa]
MTALNRFISKSTDKCLPFFNTLRGNKKFEWTEECEEAFKSIMSAAIVQEEGKHQQLVYYVIKRLLGAESRYPPIEKLALCLIHASRKLRPYFQAHPIKFDITYHPRTSIKGQALADFRIKGITPDEDPLVQRDADTWKLYVDGASNEHGSGAWMILILPKGFKFHYAFRFQFGTSNNEAEYEALIAHLKITEVLKVKNLICHSDSQLIVNQVIGEYQAKSLKMEKYLEKVWKNLEKFDYFKIEQIPREQNSNVDALAKLASQNELDELNLVPVEMLNELSKCEKEEVEIIDSSPTWMTPIVNYLLNGQLPIEKNEAQKLLYFVPRYTIVEGKLYQRGYSMPLLQCVLPTEANKIIKEIHEGFCGDHTGWQSLSKKIIRQGYYWPIINKDTRKFVKKCDKYQRFSHIPRVPPTELRMMTSPYPFAIWGIDLIGALPTRRGGAKFGIPIKIVSDNGTQFDGELFIEFCERNKIIKSFSTTEKTVIGHSPFSLPFGSEAMLPIKVNITNQEENQELLKLSLDLLEEKRINSQITNPAYQHRVTRYFNKK